MVIVHAANISEQAGAKRIMEKVAVAKAAGTSFFRRLSKDYEQLPQSSETMVYLAMTNLMLHRLKPG